MDSSLHAYNGDFVFSHISKHIFSGMPRSGRNRKARYVIVRDFRHNIHIPGLSVAPEPAPEDKSNLRDKIRLFPYC